MRDNTKIYLKIILLSVLFLTIGLFAYFKTKNVFAGVDLQVNGISNGKSASPVINITGKAKNAIYLAINDRPITIDTEGHYKESLLLLPGYNIITVKAKDKFNNQSEKVYKLTLN